MKRFVFAVIELTDPFGPPLDIEHLSDIALCLSLESGIVQDATVYASLADLAADALEGVLALPEEALRPIHQTPKGD